jgi:periplasmic protein TonB
MDQAVPPLEPLPAESKSGSEAAAEAPASTGSPGADEDYVPQFKISDAPVIPAKEVLSRIDYPSLAAKQGIEATVYLELYIDKSGRIVRATVLKDPGFGFAEAAAKALVGLVCSPARMDGEAVAVRYRYPVRFTLR